MTMRSEIDWGVVFEAIKTFNRLRLMVVGDVMLDEFIWGEAARISPEAPVPVIEVSRESKLLGGAANVARNLKSAGCEEVALVGLVGRDQASADLAELMERLGLPTAGLVAEPGRPTTIKTRVVAHSQQVIRYDRETRRRPEAGTLRRLLETVAARAPEVDAVIVSDYHKGTVGAELMAMLKDFSARGLRVLVDPKVPNVSLYRGLTALTPNHHEAAAITGQDTATPEGLLAAGRALIEDLDLKALLITRGADGMSLFRPHDPPTHIPTVARQVFDVTGAGDTAIALWTLGLAAGLTLEQAAHLANLAAGIVVGQTGTTAVARAALLKAVARRRWPGGPSAAPEDKDQRGHEPH